MTGAPATTLQLEQLTRQIRKAGSSARTIRLGTTLSLFLGSLGMSLMLSTDPTGDTGPLAPWPLLPPLAANVLLFSAIGAVAAALPLAVIYRSALQESLRRRLEGLSAEQQSAVLLPLLDERGDTKQIVRPLMRYFNGAGATEVTPASVAAGTGLEAAPAQAAPELP